MLPAQFMDQFALGHGKVEAFSTHRKFVIIKESISNEHYESNAKDSKTINAKPEYLSHCEVWWERERSPVAQKF